MTEPRMRLRQKGQQFPTQDCKSHSLSPFTPQRPTNVTTVEAFLLAFGDNDYPLPETVRVLDEIITDYIIGTNIYLVPST